MRKSGFYIVFIASLLSACSLLLDTGEPIAKVGARVLTVEELSKNVPDYLDATDSALWADDYIKKWVQRELLLLKAEENLKGNEKDVSQELQEYRNSLIVFRYKNELIRQKMDTIVKNSDIQKYYSEHHESFILNRNIVKAIYIKVPVAVSSPENLKDLCSSNDPEKQARLNEFCLSYAKAYDRFNDQWIAADLVLKYTPATIPDLELFLKRNRFIESSDMDFYYLVCIRDYRLTGQGAPVEYVQNDIKNLILSKQKLDFLKQIEKDIYKEGIDNNKVKLYKTKNNRL
ncbi:MAG: hypothetical protein Q8S54_01415 [Bacteroidota bacterium]|nr:hypothetical protein [Odoribacter sp.]MDP3641828.1 hypothetical protein [Bacteroidota bacterium]